jgi:hypothetical protein
MLARTAARGLFLTLLVGSCAVRQASPSHPLPEPETVIGAAPGSGGKGRAPRLSLAELKRNFVAACSSKVPEPPTYCECAWVQMAETFSVDEMNSTEENQPKLARLKERIEESCQGQ